MTYFSDYLVNTDETIKVYILETNEFVCGFCINLFGGLENTRKKVRESINEWNNEKLNN